MASQLHADDALVAALADELAGRWRLGDAVPAETLLARHPQLWDEPARALALVCEEICVRQELGDAVSDVELWRRFPRWRKQLELMRACHELLEPASDAAEPQAGDTIAGYRLLTPLGAGAAGRVFLAAQPALGDRPVVVKITARHGSEHCQLARLQHTHIMPLYAAHEDAERDLRILCMPYLGGAALDQILTMLADRPLPQRTGADLLRCARRDGPPAGSAGEPLLATLSYVQAICWQGACLAEALHHAHEAGILHLDLKPSNVLVTAAGQPLLLDFHLARHAVAAGDTSLDGLGGTPGYMAPEQEAGLRAVQSGRAVRLAIDRRADVFALGAVLYEALGGCMPSASGRPPPLTRLNPLVSVALADLIDRCLAPAPDDRVPTARALADDLRRHLADEPLRSVPNRSRRERWDKWRRRNPAALRIASLWATIGIIAAILVSWLAAAWHGTQSDVRQALREAREDWQSRGQFAAAMHRLRAALAQVNRWPGHDELAEELTTQMTQVEQAEAAAQRRMRVRELHSLAERVRALYGIARDTELLRHQAVTRAATAFWDRRHELRRWLETVSEPGAVEDLVDVALFAAEVRLVAHGPDQRSALEAYVARLDEIRALFGPSVVLELLRRQSLAALGSPVPQSPLPPIRSDWERFTLGRLYLRAGELAQAEPYLEAALASLRHGFWPNYYAGIVRYRAGNFTGALACFSVCIGAAPTEPSAYYNRALTFAALHEPRRARADYDRVRELDADFANTLRPLP